ncbi:restriction endonuclease subunit S [Halanaerobium congolense]|jgi:type I restriction enzyme S subunit|uniref:Type I restriction enzyme, S subunit n=1 Tax=Halanaerobium congolense TaxID=54121 RepID=A0A1G6SWV5_9FIRM|nr:restriction endonuclease subunit S [Halanaerobium congolense]SDD21269.1 type I restriction enzyme, S subunit [Halanaerobium congolense]
MSFNDDWEKVKLGDIADFQYGKYIPKDNFLKKGYPVHNGYGIKGYLSEYKYEEEQLLIVARGVGGTGDIKMSPPKCTILNLSIVISPNENKVNKNFLYWLLKYSNTYSLRTGSAQPQIIIKDLKPFSIRYPKLKNEQKKITDILSTLDKKIENNNKMNKTLEEMAQAIYKSWFVDFEPFQDEEFVDSELGMIPKGWEIKKLDKLFNFKRGIEPGSKNYEENKQKNNVKFIRVGDVGEGSRETVFIDKKFIKKEKYCNYGDILVSFDATIGRVTMIQEGCYNSGLKRIYPKKEYKDLFSNGLIYLMMKSDNIQNTINKYAAGTTILHASKSVKHLQHPFPKNDDIIINFQKKIKPIIKKILLNKKENKSLKQLRDSLLPKLMSGEIKVPLNEDVKEVK